LKNIEKTRKIFNPAGEWRHLKKNGELIYVTIVSHTITFKNRKARHVMANDITSRKMAEEALRTSEQRYHDLFNQTNEGLLMMTLDGQLSELNQAFANMHGYTLDELKNYDIRKLDVLEEKTPNDRDDQICRILSGEVIRVEVEHYHKDGHIFPLTVTTSLVNISGQKFFLAFHQDISERKQVEAKVRKKDLEFRKLSANVPDLIFQFTRKPDGTYFVPIASEGIRNIFGCSPEEVLDDFGPIGRVIYPEDAERVIHDIEYSAEHLTYFTCEFRVQIPGREIQWIYSNSTPERLSDGSVTWYGFNVDITERKQIELELQKAKVKAEESDRLKSAFLANMSHEIRTPMNGILGFSELLKEPGLSSETQSEYINIIEKSGARMLNIISEIMDISKIESGQMEIYFQETNVMRD
jgi:PAS domain S-box-containing protein